MAKQLNVNLAFSADTKQVEKQLNSLRDQLTKLINTAPSSGFSGFTKELQTATTAAATLKTQLDNAVNVDTGKLDLGKFQQSLKQSGTSLEYYKTQLTSLGPQGAAAFSQLSQAIMNAEMPLRRTSALLSNFATTLKNTARWQLSSSMLHGFMGAVQSAYYYAQDLNESLNNIRIVTGKNTDEMAKFAQEANEAAKALSTTTTAYTDASLIYYQQGLSDEDVKARTDVTVKLANVSRQTAEEVSQQLTAIWNNFDNGTKSLEYYVDAITALGATTASSSAEIAEGLEKFAAVANTVGLSYEYATSALATVTAATRQSADIVGNAFKTLFARLEGLNLGETLDDGTDLNKYSQALDKVGISIKTVSGDMKSMDQILDELGLTWQTLGKDQQIALAQTVAGVRQYTQLIALMDNWTNFQKNVATARGSEGTLQEQAEIYAESWEAASKRVKTSAESVYQNLLNDKFFIQLNNNLSKTLDLVNTLIKSLGGVKGILLLSGNLLFKLFGTQLTEGINNSIYSLKMLTKNGQESIQQTKQEINSLLQDFYKNDFNPYNQQIGKAYEQQGKAQEIFIEKTKALSEEQRKVAAILLDQHKTLVDNVVLQAKLANDANKKAEDSLRGARLGASPAARASYTGLAEAAKKEGRFTAVNDSMFADFSSAEYNFKNLQNNIKTLKAHYDELGLSFQKVFPEEAAKSFEVLYNILSNVTKEEELTDEKTEQLKKALDELGKTRQEIEEGTENLSERVRILVAEEEEERKTVIEVEKASREAGITDGELVAKKAALNVVTETWSERLETLKAQLISVGNVVTEFAQATVSAAMASNTIVNAFSSLGDSSISISQKITSLGMGVGFFSRNIVSAVNGMKKAKEATDSLAMASNAYLLVITVVLTAIQAITSALEKQRQAAIEASKVSVELAEKTREEAKANEELYNSYTKLYNDYKNGIGVKEDLYDITDQLADAYGKEHDVIAKLSGNYDDFTESIKRARLEQLELLKQQNSDVLKERPYGTFLEGKTGKGDIYGNQYVYDLGDNAASYFRSQGYENLVSTEYDYHSFMDTSWEERHERIRIDASDYNNLIQYYEALESYKSTLDVTSKEYKKIKEELDQLSNGYKATKEALEDLQQITLKEQDASILTNFTSGNIQDKVGQFKNSLRNNEYFKGLSDNDFEKIVSDYLYSLNNTIIDEFLLQEELVKKKLRKEALMYIQGLNSSEKQFLLTLGITFDETTTEEELRTTLQNARDRIGSVSIPIDMMTSLQESLLKGKDINKSDWDNLLANIPESAQKLLGDREDFNNKGLVERLQLMQQVNQLTIENSSLTIENIQNHREETKNAFNKYEEEVKILKAKRDELEKHLMIASPEAAKHIQEALNKIDEQIESFLNKKRLLKIEPDLALDAFYDKVNTSAEMVLNDINAIQSGVDLIGDGWIVAAEDVRQFAALFPDIVEQLDKIDGAKRLDDGRLQLTKEQVDTVLKGNAEIIESNKQVVVHSLDMKLAQLRAELEFQQKKEKIIRETLENEKGSIDYEGQLQQAGQDYVNKLRESGVQVAADAWDQAMKDAAMGSNNIIDSLDAINQAVIKVHDNIANIWNKDAAMDAITETAVASNTGSTTWTSSINIDDSWQVYQEEVQKLQNELNNSLTSQKYLTEEIAATEGLRAKVLADASNLYNSIGRASSGQGKSSQKELDEQLDRYWDINNAIASINTQLEKEEAEMNKLSTMSSKVFGKELISNLQAQNKQLEKRNKILQEQKRNYQQLYSIQQGELGDLKATLAGFGGRFSGNVLTNYSSIMASALGNYQNAVNQYNRSAQNDADKARLESAEKYYNKLKEYTERYSDLYYNEMADTQNKLSDLAQEEMENQLKVLENNLKSWEIEIELKLDASEMTREWNEFIKQIEQDFRKVYQDLTIESVFGKNNFEIYAEDVNTTLKAIKDVEDEIEILVGGGKSNMFASVSEAQEKLKELQSQLISQGKDLADVYSGLWDNYISGMGQVSSKLNDINNQYKKLNDELNYEKSLIELLYGDKAFALMNKFYDAQSANIMSQMDSMKTQIDFWNNEFQKSYLMNKDQHNIDLENMATWTADMKNAYDQMQESQSNLNDLILEGVRSLQDDYLNAINQIIDTMNQSVWGSSLDEMKADWDHIQKLAQEYLDDVEGAYAIQSLANKIDQGIASTSTLANQQKLQKLRDNEIAMLREKDNLTQHDIDLAEARYQIALKEMALEDAQNSKNSMKLTRDASGNWTYQYVADEDDVKNKQQDLLDAYNNLYKMSDDAYNHAMELAMNTYQEMQNKILEVANDMTLAEEEKLEKIQEIYDTYLAEIDAAVSNAELYRREAMMAGASTFAEVCEQDIEAYETLTERQKEIVDLLKDHHLAEYEEIRAAIVDDIYPGIAEASKEAFEETNLNSQTAAAQVLADWAEDNGVSVRSQMKQAYQDIQKSVREYGKDLNKLEEISRVNFENIGNYITHTQELTDGLENATESLCNNSTGYLDTLRRSVDEVATSYGKLAGQIANARDQMVRLLNAMGQEVSVEDIADIPSVGYGNNLYTSNINKTDGGGNNIDAGNFLKLVAEANKKALEEAINELRSIQGGAHGYLPDGNHPYLNQLELYDTGGYTGTWDDTGRLAILHQKELVLNANDTANILNAVTAIRDLSRLNDSIGSAIASSIGQMAINLAMHGTGNIGVGASSNTDNNFYITAEFPNANDVETIREAILTLPNLASQYIHKN